MIVGIVLTVLLGAIALRQTWCLWAARHRLLTLTLEHNERQQQYLAVGLAMEQAHLACLRGDGPALHEAIREANRVMAGVPSKEAT